MEDYIKREMDKIAKVIEAICIKIGLLKKENKSDDFIMSFSKLELLERLNINVDELLQNENLADVLIHEYKFNEDNLNQLANLLFDFIKLTESTEEKKKLIACICKLYEYLDKIEYPTIPFSFDRVYILEELKNIHKTFS
jgi:hypothetical protein